MTIEFPKLKLMVMAGHTWYAIDKDNDTKTKSASIPKEENSNKKPAWIRLYESQFGGIE